MIEVLEVSKRYGETTVVDDVTLTIRKGGITSIIGPNGAGKSSLLGMISRLSPMDAGKVTVDGLDVSTTPSDQLARRLSILRQDNHIPVRLTVEELVAFGRYPYTKGRPNREDKEHIDAAIDYLNLNEFRTRFLDQLSGGQRQRAFVAMVLCQDTDYVLLDEPLNSLDMKHSVDMMQLLRKTADELNKTIVLVLHVRALKQTQQMVGALRVDRVKLALVPDEGAVGAALGPFTGQIATVLAATAAAGVFRIH